MLAHTTNRAGRLIRAVARLAFAPITALALAAAPAQAGGTLTPIGSANQPIQILDHHVDVVINNGFARTEVQQTFFNPNPTDLEAIYAFPIPRSASLSEVTITISEKEIHGEVLPRQQAEQLYQEEASKGKEAGLATKSDYQNFEFRVSPVRAQDQTKIGFVYYQPLEIDTGVGRYVYPLEDGGTDELAESFWTRNETVQNAFSFNVELKSAVPVDSVRIPGFENSAVIDQLSAGHCTARIETQGGTLNKDLVLYYRLQDGLPGGVELIAYRADPNEPGTFMMVVTPGIDLKPLERGADYTFVLDVSGSMESKLHTLAQGVTQVLGKMTPNDRYRVVTFSTDAQDLSGGWHPATPENVRHTIAQVEQLQSQGSTNLYAGLKQALNGLDDDRATSIVLVTDGVTNTGVIDPKAFHELTSRYDVRFFGFLMGNNANWPLVRSICESSGGFYAAVSNSDDIVGQIMLAKSKILYECLHDADLRISGVKTFDSNEGALGKVYRGQQLVLFGRYEKGSKAKVRLAAKLTGQDKTYETTFDFPDIDTANPEIERLWAMSRVEAIDARRMIGDFDPSEAKTAIRDLGVAYQIVTDETAMVVLGDSSFEEHGIERRNQARTAIEQQARAARAGSEVRDHRVDQQQPMFNQPAPSPGNGGGAIDPISGAIVLGLGATIGLSRRRRVPIDTDGGNRC